MRLLRLAALASACLVAAACSSPPSASPVPSTTPPPSLALRPACPTAAPAALPVGSLTSVSLETTRGTIRIEVGTDDPIAAASFVALVACGYYEGTVFHRIVPNFVVDGGDGQYGRSGFVDEAKVGTGGPGYTLPDETKAAAYPRGTVVLSRSGKPDSAGSRFFVVLDERAASAIETSDLPFASVGIVSEGLDVLDAIAALPNGGSPGNLPLTPVTIIATAIIAAP